MPMFTYDIYYRFNGPTLAEPLAEGLDNEQVKRNIEIFFVEIESHFTDTVSTFERCDGDRINITTDISRKDCDARVKRCLGSLDLSAIKGAVE